jgi:hypothetical protein
MNSPKLPKVDGIPILPNLGPNLPFVPGSIFHVRPRYGSDANGRPNDVTRAYKSITAAFAAAVPDQNDVILLYSEGTSAIQGAQKIDTTLTWNKNGVHLIGVGPGGHYGLRAGLRFIDAYDTASNLITVSASNCLFRNIYFYEGVAGTNPTGCLRLTGAHNTFEGCHIAGMGNAANVIANAYSLNLVGAQENKFKDCIIGYGQQRGAVSTTAEIYFASSAGRNIFENCILMCGTSSATNHVFVNVAASGNLDFILFKNCSFINAGVNGGGANITYGFTVNVNPGGTILLDHCASAGLTDWSDNCGSVWAQTEGAAGTGGIGAVQTK